MAIIDIKIMDGVLTSDQRATLAMLISDYLDATEGEFMPGATLVRIQPESVAIPATAHAQAARRQPERITA